MAHFVIATQTPEQYPHHDQFECCLIGRSNVGKSSIINALAKAKIAYVSKTPGRTQTVNFYDFHQFWLVDLPGYGHAKVSRAQKTHLVTIAETYLYHRYQLMSIVQVCDMSVLTQLDVEMKNYLNTKFNNYILCLNKADKLSYSQQKKRLQEIMQLMNLTSEQIIIISAKKSVNIFKLFSLIKAWTKK